MPEDETGQDPADDSDFQLDDAAAAAAGEDEDNYVFDDLYEMDGEPDPNDSSGGFDALRSGRGRGMGLGGGRDRGRGRGRGRGRPPGGRRAAAAAVAGQWEQQTELYLGLHSDPAHKARADWCTRRVTVDKSAEDITLEDVLSVVPRGTPLAAADMTLYEETSARMPLVPLDSDAQLQQLLQRKKPPHFLWLKPHPTHTSCLRSHRYTSQASPPQYQSGTVLRCCRACDHSAEHPCAQQKPQHGRCGGTQKDSSALCGCRVCR